MDVRDASPRVREEPVPKYFRIERAVLERIASGVWPRGAPIPSEELRLRARD